MGHSYEGEIVEKYKYVFFFFFERIKIFCYNTQMNEYIYTFKSFQ